VDGRRDDSDKRGKRQRWYNEWCVSTSRLGWTSDLIGLIIDIGLKEKCWINLGVIMNRSYYSYEL